MSEWDERSACLGSDTDLFFEGALRNGQDVRARREHVEVSAKFCDVCPVRRECLAHALIEEATSPMKHRYGLRGCLTPAQRYSVTKRGGADCPECGTPFDPIMFRTGVLKCDRCGLVRRVQAIPDDGDDWQDRHTLLAVRILDYFIEHHSVRGGAAQLPSPHWLAKKLDVRKADVGRVYDSFVYDTTIEKRGAIYWLQATKDELRVWTPPHFVSVSQAWRTVVLQSTT
jgi:Transcription factor WhiB